MYIHINYKPLRCVDIIEAWEKGSLLPCQVANQLAVAQFLREGPSFQTKQYG